MSWNKEKLTRELDANSLRKGVILAVRDKPKIGCENVLEHLESGDATDCQIINGLLLLLEFVRSIQADLNVERYLALIQNYISSENIGVREKAGYCLINVTLWVQVYRNMAEFRSNTEMYLKLIKDNCTELYQKQATQVEYIRELNAKNA